MEGSPGRKEKAGKRRWSVLSLVCFTTTSVVLGRLILFLLRIKLQVLTPDLLAKRKKEAQKAMSEAQNLKQAQKNKTMTQW